MLKCEFFIVKELFQYVTLELLLAFLVCAFSQLQLLWYRNTINYG